MDFSTLANAKRSFVSIRIKVSLLNLYASPSELCHIEEEIRLMETYLNYPSHFDDNEAALMRADLEILKLMQ